MSNFQDHIKNAAKALVANMVEHDAEEWPPTCIVLAYQPMRPTKQVDSHQLTDDDLLVQSSSK